MSVVAQDINGNKMASGSSVAVRCTVLSVNLSAPNSDPNAKAGCGDRVTVQVLSPGNTGEVTPGPIFTISPKQCQLSVFGSQLRGS